MKTPINIEQPGNSTTNTRVEDYAEMWYQRTWRPMMAAIYMFLCVLDYGVRPMINYYQSTNFNLSTIVKTIEPLEPMVQIEIINAAKRETITPILTEFVHLAFGAILGISAFSRGASKNFAEGTPIVPIQPTRPIGNKSIKQEIDNLDNSADG